MDDNKTKTRRRIDPLKTALAALILSMLQAASNPAAAAANFQLRSPNGQVSILVGLKEQKSEPPIPGESVPTIAFVSMERRW